MVPAVSLLKTKDELVDVTSSFIITIENNYAKAPYRVRPLRAEKATENTAKKLQDFCANLDIEFKAFLPYAMKSNAIAERLVQEDWMRERTLMFASDLPANFWAEAINNAN